MECLKNSWKNISLYAQWSCGLFPTALTENIGLANSAIEQTCSSFFSIWAVNCWLASVNFFYFLAKSLHCIAKRLKCGFACPASFFKSLLQTLHGVKLSNHKLHFIVCLHGGFDIDIRGVRRTNGGSGWEQRQFSDRSFTFTLFDTETEGGSQSWLVRHTKRRFWGTSSFLICTFWVDGLIRRTW